MLGSSYPILDRQIRGALASDLRATDCTATIINELPLLRNGRADVAAVNGVMAGYEIKSASDSLVRLSLQIPMYEAVFDYCSVVVAPVHLKRVRLLIPAKWGIFVAKVYDDELAIRQLRQAKINRSIQIDAIIRLLWKPELSRLLRQQAVKCEGSSIRMMWSAAQKLPLDAVREAARNALKARALPRVVER